MMKTFTADHCIKSIFGKGKILTVAYYQFYTLHLLSFGNLDHFRRQIYTGIVLFRILFMQQSKHGACSATAIQKIDKRLFFKFCQYIGIVLFTHIVHTCIVRFIDLGSFGKLFYG